MASPPRPPAPFLLLRFPGLQFHQLTSRWQHLPTKPQPSPCAAGLRSQSKLPYMTLCRFIRGVTITQTSGCRRICLTTFPISHLGLAPPLQGLIFRFFFLNLLILLLSISSPCPHLFYCYRECDDMRTCIINVYAQFWKVGGAKYINGACGTCTLVYLYLSYVGDM